MSTTKATSVRSLSWLAMGVVMGAVSLGSVLWIGGWIGTAGTQSTADPSATMEMAGGNMATSSGTAMAGTESVRITPDQIQRFGITFGVVEERTMEARIRTASCFETSD